MSTVTSTINDTFLTNYSTPDSLEFKRKKKKDSLKNERLLFIHWIDLFSMLSWWMEIELTMNSYEYENKLRFIRPLNCIFVIFLQNAFAAFSAQLVKVEVLKKLII